MKKIIFKILFLFLFGYAQSQTSLLTKHYTPNDGLASSETYFVKTDSKGFLWIGTDRGLNKFDGKTFTTYTTANGLGTNFVDKIFINPYNQQIWAKCLDKKLYYFENDIFKPYKYNVTLSNILNKSYDEVINIFFNESAIEKIYTKRNGILVNGKIDLQKKDSSIHKFLTVSIDADNNLPYGSFTSKQLLDMNQPLFKICSVHFKNNMEDFAELTNADGRIQIIKRRNGSNLLAVGNWLFEIKNNKITAEFKYPYSILNLFEDNKNYIWLSINKSNGVYRYAANQFPTATNGEILFSNYLVSNITQDNEKNYWISTHDDGLYFLPNLSITQIDIPVNVNKKEIVNSIESASDGLLFAGTNKQNIYWKKNNRWNIFNCKTINFGTNKFEVNSTRSSNCNYLNYDEPSKQLFFAMPYTGVINMQSLKQENISLGYAFYIKKINETNAISVGANSIIIKNSISNEHSSISITEERNYSASYFNNQYWIGSESGLFILKKTYNNLKDSLIKFLNFTKKTRVTALEKISNTTLVAGTLGEGVFITNGANGKYFKLNDISFPNQNGYNMVNDIEVNNDTIFAATQNGIVWFNAMQDKPSLHYISSKTGIVLNDVKSISFSNNHLYILNQNRIIDIDFLEYNKGITQTPCYLQKITINDTISFNSDTTNFILNPTENRIKFNFGAISFKSGTQVYYQYRLLKNDKDTSWVSTQNDVIEFFTLPPNSYIFQLRAVNEDNTPSTIVKQIAFEIKKPYYNNLWFIASLILGTVVIFFILNAVRIQRIKKQNKLKEKLLEYEQQALAAQINPHFIFNTLNSIQSFILKDDKRQTLKYLSSFSKLMRLSLDNSRAKWVVPQAEIDLITVYLELEALRHSNKFIFELEVADIFKLNDYLIPSMLSQPFIENAIKHGIKNLEKKQGKIKIKAELQLPEQNVLITIEDNGIGREKAKSLVNDLHKNHLSSGVDITINRIRLLSYECNKKYYFEIIDKPYGEGTIVKFFLPHKINISKDANIKNNNSR